MKEISVFCDESGGENGHSRYCLVTLVFHDQDDDIAELIESYREALDKNGLPYIPFHTSPCMNGHDAYEGMNIELRKKMLVQFFIFQRLLPYRYRTFVYRRSEVCTREKFAMRFRRDLAVFISDNLGFFQSFDRVKIYYDGGQDMVSQALHAAIDYMLSKNAVLYKYAASQRYCLSQVADFICTMELTAIKFENRELTPADEKFFGLSSSKFKKLYLRHIRKKRL